MNWLPVLRRIAIILLIIINSCWSRAVAEEFTRELKQYPYDLNKTTVIGTPSWAEIKVKDTLLDVARRYDLSYYNELEFIYPRIDEWIPPAGKILGLPTIWVLPPTKHQQLVINLPEQRLYYFNKASASVQTYPIGIGDEGWETPVGVFHIFEKRPNPAWYIPESLQAKYGMKVMPAGPDNPLGDFMMKFSAGAYGIHGTNIPWGVGGLVSHGCIRLYPEDIKILYPQVKLGTKLEIMYEPIKIGQRDGCIYIEAHPDIYLRIPDYQRYAMEKLKQMQLTDKIDLKRFQLAIFLQKGIPADISRSPLADYSERTIINSMLQ
jgi:L,D-transpeptidase ErfK/SrfK